MADTNKPEIKRVILYSRVSTLEQSGMEQADALQQADKCYIFLVTTRLENSYRRHKLPILFRLDIMQFVQLQFSGIYNSYIVPEFNCTNE